MIHPLAGVLSAYGMGLADMVELRQRSLAGADLEAVLAELAAEATAALEAQGVEAPEIRRRAALRYEGSDSSLEVAVSDRMREDFEAAHRMRFGFIAPETAVVIETAIVEAVGRNSSPAFAGEGDQPQAGGGAPPPHFLRSPSPGNPGEDLYDRSDLKPGDVVTGPALIIDPSATTVVEPGWRAEVDDLGNLILTRAAPRRVAAGRRRGRRSGDARSDGQPLHGDRRGDGGGAAEHRLVGQHQGAARFLLRDLRPRGQPDRQRAAHPGPSRLDGRFDPHRSSTRAARTTRGAGRRPRDEAGRRLCAERPLSRRHPSARHHRHHAGVRRTRATPRPPGTSPRAATMPISAASRRARCRPTAGRSTRRAC